MKDSSSAKCRRTVHFDLNTNALKANYPGRNHRDAYSDIQNYMKRHGFVHRQYSGYDSKEPMTDNDLVAVIQGLSDEFYWLKECVQKIDTAEIGERHDLMDIILNAHNDELLKEPIKAEISRKTESVTTEKRPSVLAALKTAKSIADEHNQAHLPKNKKKDKDQSL